MTIPSYARDMLISLDPTRPDSAFEILSRVGHAALGREYLDACEKLRNVRMGDLRLFLWADGNPNAAPHKERDLTPFVAKRDEVWQRILEVKAKLEQQT